MRGISGTIRRAGSILWSGAQTASEYFVTAPYLHFVSPARVAIGSGAMVLHVRGVFQNGDTVQVGGADRATTFVDGDDMTVPMTPADFAAPGKLLVRVKRGALKSRVAPLYVGPDPLSPLPRAQSIVPDTVSAAGGDFPITVTGTGFAPGDVIVVDGVALADSDIVSATEATGTVDVDILGAGTYPVAMRRGAATTQTKPLTVTP